MPGRSREGAARPRRLREELDAQRREVFAKLTPWQKTLVARHPNRPYTLDYVQALFTEWTELHGDRRFGDDPALVCGFALYKDRPVCVVGHQKGRDTKQKIYRNFGMPKPEGYRKALRVMELAAKFGRPDPDASWTRRAPTRASTPRSAARPRRSPATCARWRGSRTPIVVTVTGEGGSGGALAIAVGDRVNMLEHAVYSVISPEGCASILWRDASRAEEAAAGHEDHGPRPAGPWASSTRSSRSRPAARTSTTSRSSRASTRCCGASCRSCASCRPSGSSRSATASSATWVARAASSGRRRPRRRSDARGGRALWGRFGPRL